MREYRPFAGGRQRRHRCFRSGGHDPVAHRSVDRRNRFAASAVDSQGSCALWIGLHSQGTLERSRTGEPKQILYILHEGEERVQVAPDRILLDRADAVKVTARWLAEKTSDTGSSE